MHEKVVTSPCPLQKINIKQRNRTQIQHRYYKVFFPELVFFKTNLVKNVWMVTETYMFNLVFGRKKTVYYLKSIISCFICKVSEVVLPIFSL